MRFRSGRSRLKAYEEMGTSEAFKSLRSQRADRVGVGELGGWETVAREWGTGVCDFYGGAVLRDAKVCVSHGHRGLKWNGCGGSVELERAAS